jgi:hypothetical protein
VTNSGVKDQHAVRPTKIFTLSILSALLVGGLALTNQSLWIDEANSATKAIQPSLASWWAKMVSEKGSDLQMPFYMLYLWAWAKVFGSSEIALRAANLPWFALGLFALRRAFTQDRYLQWSITAIALTNAFLWYYISEARPYIMLFAFSALTAACLFRLREDREFAIESTLWFRLFCLGLVGICSTNLIAVPWALGALAAFVFWTGPRRALEATRRSIWSFSLTTCAMIALATYYFWTLRLGARASEVGRSESATLGFALYELLGIAGLGPSRLALREAGVSALVLYAWPVAAGVIAVLTLCAAATAELWNKIMRRDAVFFTLAAGFPAVLLIAAGFIGHIRLLGRHFMPVLPFLTAFLAVGWERLITARRFWSTLIAISATLVLFASALEIRVASRHQRDDYRSAANEARQAIVGGKKVWWAADINAAAYYGVPLSSPNLTLSSKFDGASFQNLVTPDLVIFSKPDIYDPQGKIDNYLREHDFKVTRVLPAFQIFERQRPRR